MRSIAVAARPGESTDDAVVRRAAAGDAEAFDLLVTTRLERCYRLALAILANHADAADATQDGFLAAWRELPRLRDPRSFDAWLNRIVANAARMSRRHRVRLREVRVEPVLRQGDAEPSVDRHDPAGLVEIDRVASGDSIVRAFHRLREADRLLLVLHHVEERPLAEIARTLGIPVGTAKRRLFTARRALEQAMEAES